MPGGNGDLLFCYLKDKKLKLPFVFLTTEDITTHDTLKDFFNFHPQNEHISKAIPQNEFNHAITKVFNGSLSDRNFVAINIKRLARFDTLSADLHIKLSDTKYVKIYNKNTPLTSDLLGKYQDLEKVRGKLYMKTEQYSDFTNGLIDSLKSIGLSEKSINMAHDAYESSMINVKKVKGIHKILDKLLKREDYINEHSMLLFYLCHIISEAMGWKSHQISEKFHLASLLHDSVLEEVIHAKIESSAEEDFINLEHNIQKMVLNHPIQSANFVKSLPNIPPDVDIIISQHH